MNFALFFYHLFFLVSSNFFHPFYLNMKSKTTFLKMILDLTVPPYSLCTFLMRIFRTHPNKNPVYFYKIPLETWLRITQSEKIITYTPMWSGPH